MAIFAARLISSQGMGVVFKNSDYDHISKVYSIWICPKPSKSCEDLFFAYRLENSKKGIRRWLKRKAVGILP